MSFKGASFGCVGTTILIGGALAIIAMISPMAFGFFAAMSIGIVEGALKEIPFRPQNAIVIKYDKECAPAPSLISSAQPKCIVDGEDGAMLTMIYFSYEAGRRQVVGKTKTAPSWGEPAVGSKATIFVSMFDSSKFKLKRGGWLNPGYCGDGVCR